MLSCIKYALRNQKGQGMVEYGLIIALVAVALVATMTGLKDKISAFFATIAF